MFSGKNILFNFRKKFKQSLVNLREGMYRLFVVITLGSFLSLLQLYYIHIPLKRAYKHYNNIARAKHIKCFFGLYPSVLRPDPVSVSLGYGFNCLMLNCEYSEYYMYKNAPNRCETIIACIFQFSFALVTILIFEQRTLRPNQFVFRVKATIELTRH